MKVETITVTDYKFSTVSATLSSLKINSLYKVHDIGTLILNIENFTKKTNIPQSRKSVLGQNLIEIKDLYVDMTYQRIIRLQELLNRIKNVGFEESAAGVIDIALRPDGTRVVWDGFRRTLMAMICGRTVIQGSIYTHNENIDDAECRKVEAKLFRMRNTAEKMKPEEIFRSEVVYEDEIALSILSFLKKCNLDVAGLNPKGKTIGGISEIRLNYKNWSKNVDEDTDSDGPYDWDENIWIESSKIIQSIWNSSKDHTVSVYLLSNLAWVKTVMLSCDKSYSDDEIIEAINKWRKKTEKYNQKDITSAGFKKKRLVSCYIAKEILKDDNGLYDKLFNHMDKEQQALFSTVE